MRIRLSQERVCQKLWPAGKRRIKCDAKMRQEDNEKKPRSDIPTTNLSLQSFSMESSNDQREEHMSKQHQRHHRLR